MKRKTSDIPSRIWNFGLPHGPDPESAAAVEEQLERAHAFFNKLVEIKLAGQEAYRAKREEVAQIIGSPLSGLTAERDDLGARRVEIIDEIKLRRQGSRKRIAKTAEQADELRKIDVRRAELRPLITAAREELDASPAMASASAEISAKRYALEKAARQESGCYWPTYLLTIKAASSATQFRRWDGSGSIGAHLMHGISVAELRESCTMIRLETLHGVGENRCVASRLSFRIGKHEMARFNCSMHRDLPPDARIKNAIVTRERIGGRIPRRRNGEHITKLNEDPRYRWTLSLVMEARSFEAPARLPSHACAINLGWRLLDSGALRVAYMIGTDGREKSITLDGCAGARRASSVLARRDKERHLISIAGRMFDEARAKLLEWKPPATAPAWFTERTRTLHAWRSPWHLVELCQFWRAHRFEGDDEIMGVEQDPRERYSWRGLHPWTIRHAHLREWIDNSTQRTTRYRQDLYRKISFAIAKRYSTIILHGFDLAKVARRAEAGESELEQTARYHRTVAALHILRDAIKHAAWKAGSEYIERPKFEKITVPCRACGSDCDVNRKLLRHVCEHCSAEWDQDCNAARNLLVLQHREAAE